MPQSLKLIVSRRRRADLWAAKELFGRDPRPRRLLFTLIGFWARVNWWIGGKSSYYLMHGSEEEEQKEE